MQHIPVQIWVRMNYTWLAPLHKRTLRLIFVMVQWVILTNECPCLPSVNSIISVHLMPIYKPFFRCLEHVERRVKSWSEDSVSAHQACFDCTDWQCFYDVRDDINELSETVSTYITFCVNLSQLKKLLLIQITRELKSVQIK